MGGFVDVFGGGSSPEEGLNIGGGGGRPAKAASPNSTASLVAGVGAPAQPSLLQKIGGPAVELPPPDDPDKLLSDLRAQGLDFREDVGLVSNEKVGDVTVPMSIATGAYFLKAGVDGAPQDGWYSWDTAKSDWAPAPTPLKEKAALTRLDGGKVTMTVGGKVWKSPRITGDKTLGWYDPATGEYHGEKAPEKSFGEKALGAVKGVAKKGLSIVKGSRDAVTDVGEGAGQVAEDWLSMRRAEVRIAMMPAGKAKTEAIEKYKRDHLESGGMNAALGVLERADDITQPVQFIFEDAKAQKISGWLQEWRTRFPNAQTIPRKFFEDKIADERRQLAASVGTMGGPGVGRGADADLIQETLEYTSRDGRKEINPKDLLVMVDAHERYSRMKKDGLADLTFDNAFSDSMAAVALDDLRDLGGSAPKIKKEEEIRKDPKLVELHNQLVDLAKKAQMTKDPSTRAALNAQAEPLTQRYIIEASTDPKRTQWLMAEEKRLIAQAKQYGTGENLDEGSEGKSQIHELRKNKAAQLGALAFDVASMIAAGSAGKLGGVLENVGRTFTGRTVQAIAQAFAFRAPTMVNSAMDRVDRSMEAGKTPGQSVRHAMTGVMGDIAVDAMMFHPNFHFGFKGNSAKVVMGNGTLRAAYLSGMASGMHYLHEGEFNAEEYGKSFVHFLAWETHAAGKNLATRGRQEQLKTSYGTKDVAEAALNSQLENAKLKLNTSLEALAKNPNDKVAKDSLLEARKQLANVSDGFTALHFLDHNKAWGKPVAKPKAEVQAEKPVAKSVESRSEDAAMEAGFPDEVAPARPTPEAGPVAGLVEGVSRGKGAGKEPDPLEGKILPTTEADPAAPPVVPEGVKHDATKNVTFYLAPGNEHGSPGWKLHIPGVSPEATPYTVKLMEFLKEKGVSFKIGQSGPGKEMTIYAGSRDEAVRLSKEIEAKFEINGYPDGRQVSKEALVGEKIRGRFDALQTEGLASYGDGSVPVRLEDYDGHITGKDPEAGKKGHAHAKKAFGERYTGKEHPFEPFGPEVPEHMIPMPKGKRPNPVDLLPKLSPEQQAEHDSAVTRINQAKARIAEASLNPKGEPVRMADFVTEPGKVGPKPEQVAERNPGTEAPKAAEVPVDTTPPNRTVKDHEWENQTLAINTLRTHSESDPVLGPRFAVKQAADIERAIDEAIAKGENPEEAAAEVYNGILRGKTGLAFIAQPAVEAIFAYARQRNAGLAKSGEFAGVIKRRLTPVAQTKAPEPKPAPASRELSQRREKPLEYMGWEEIRQLVQAEIGTDIGPDRGLLTGKFVKLLKEHRENNTEYDRKKPEPVAEKPRPAEDDLPDFTSDLANAEGPVVEPPAGVTRKLPEGIGAPERPIEDDAASLLPKTTEERVGLLPPKTPENKDWRIAEAKRLIGVTLKDVGGFIDDVSQYNRLQVFKKNAKSLAASMNRIYGNEIAAARIAKMRGKQAPERSVESQRRLEALNTSLEREREAFAASVREHFGKNNGAEAQFLLSARETLEALQQAFPKLEGKSQERAADLFEMIHSAVENVRAGEKPNMQEWTQIVEQIVTPIKAGGLGYYDHDSEKMEQAFRKAAHPRSTGLGERFPSVTSPMGRAELVKRYISEYKEKEGLHPAFTMKHEERVEHAPRLIMDPQGLKMLTLHELHNAQASINERVPRLQESIERLEKSLAADRSPHAADAVRSLREKIEKLESGLAAAKAQDSPNKDSIESQAREISEAKAELDGYLEQNRISGGSLKALLERQSHDLSRLKAKLAADLEMKTILEGVMGGDRSDLAAWRKGVLSKWSEAVAAAKDRGVLLQTPGPNGDGMEWANGSAQKVMPKGIRGDRSTWSSDPDLGASPAVPLPGRWADRSEKGRDNYDFNAEETAYSEPRTAGMLGEYVARIGRQAGGKVGESFGLKLAEGKPVFVTYAKKASKPSNPEQTFKERVERNVTPEEYDRYDQALKEGRDKLKDVRKEETEDREFYTMDNLAIPWFSEDGPSVISLMKDAGIVFVPSANISDGQRSRTIQPGESYVTAKKLQELLGVEHENSFRMSLTGDDKKDGQNARVTQYLNELYERHGEQATDPYMEQRVNDDRTVQDEQGTYQASKMMAEHQKQTAISNRSRKETLKDLVAKGILKPEHFQQGTSGLKAYDGEIRSLYSQLPQAARGAYKAALEAAVETVLPGQDSDMGLMTRDFLSKIEKAMVEEGVGTVSRAEIDKRMDWLKKNIFTSEAGGFAPKGMLHAEATTKLWEALDSWGVAERLGIGQPAGAEDPSSSKSMKAAGFSPIKRPIREPELQRILAKQRNQQALQAMLEDPATAKLDDMAKETLYRMELASRLSPKEQRLVDLLDFYGAKPGQTIHVPGADPRTLDAFTPADQAIYLNPAHQRHGEAKKRLQGIIENASLNNEGAVDRTSGEYDSSAEFGFPSFEGDGSPVVSSTLGQLYQSGGPGGLKLADGTVLSRDLAEGIPQLLQRVQAFHAASEGGGIVGTDKIINDTLRVAGHAYRDAIERGQVSAQGLRKAVTLEVWRKAGKDQLLADYQAKLDKAKTLADEFASISKADEAVLLSEITDPAAKFRTHQSLSRAKGTVSAFKEFIENLDPEMVVRLNMDRKESEVQSGGQGRTGGASMGRFRTMTDTVELLGHWRDFVNHFRAKAAFSADGQRTPDITKMRLEERGKMKSAAQADLVAGRKPAFTANIEAAKTVIHETLHWVETYMDPAWQGKFLTHFSRARSEFFARPDKRVLDGIFGPTGILGEVALGDGGAAMYITERHLEKIQDYAKDNADLLKAEGWSVREDQAGGFGLIGPQGELVAGYEKKGDRLLPVARFASGKDYRYWSPSEYFAVVGADMMAAAGAAREGWVDEARTSGVAYRKPKLTDVLEHVGDAAIGGSSPDALIRQRLEQTRNVIEAVGGSELARLSPVAKERFVRTLADAIGSGSHVNAGFGGITPNPMRQGLTLTEAKAKARLMVDGSRLDIEKARSVDYANRLSLENLMDTIVLKDAKESLKAMKDGVSEHFDVASKVGEGKLVPTVVAAAKALVSADSMTMGTFNLAKFTNATNLRHQALLSQDSANLMGLDGHGPLRAIKTVVDRDHAPYIERSLRKTVSMMSVDTSVVEGTQNRPNLKVEIPTRNGNETYHVQVNDKGEVTNWISEKTLKFWDFLENGKSGEGLTVQEKGELLKAREYLKVANEEQWQMLLDTPGIDREAMMKRREKMGGGLYIAHKLTRQLGGEAPGTLDDQIYDLNNGPEMLLGAVNQVAGALHGESKRLMERHFKTMREAVDAGFLPKHRNPISAAVEGRRQISNLIAFRETLENLQDMGLGILTTPENVQDKSKFIEYKLSGAKEDLAVLGLDWRGAWLTKEQKADIEARKDVRFYIKPEVKGMMDAMFGQGLSGSKVFRSVMKMNAFLNPFQLAGAFHTGTTMGFLNLGARLGTAQAYFAEGLYNRFREAGTPEAEAKRLAWKNMKESERLGSFMAAGKKLQTNLLHHGAKRPDDILMDSNLNQFEKAFLILSQSAGLNSMRNPLFEFHHGLMASESFARMDAPMDSARGVFDKMLGGAKGSFHAASSGVLERFNTFQMGRGVAGVKLAFAADNFGRYLAKTYDIHKEGWIGDMMRDLRDPESQTSKFALQVGDRADDIFGMANLRKLYLNPKMRDTVLALTRAFTWHLGNNTLMLKGWDEALQTIPGVKKAYVPIKKALGGTVLSEGQPRLASSFIAAHTASIMAFNYLLMKTLGAYTWSDETESEGGFMNYMKDLAAPVLSDGEKTGAKSYDRAGEARRVHRGYTQEWATMLAAPHHHIADLVTKGRSPSFELAKGIVKAMAGAEAFPGVGVGDPDTLAFLSKDQADAVREWKDEKANGSAVDKAKLTGARMATVILNAPIPMGTGSFKRFEKMQTDDGTPIHWMHKYLSLLGDRAVPATKPPEEK